MFPQIRREPAVNIVEAPPPPLRAWKTNSRMELRLHLLFFACLNARTGAELQTEPEPEWRLTDNYLQLCHFPFHSLSLLVSMARAGSLAPSPSLRLRSDTRQSDVTHWRLRWQQGRQGHTHLPLTKDMHSFPWQALTHTHTHTCTRVRARMHSHELWVFCRQGLFSCLCNLRSNYLLKFHPSHLRMFRKKIITAGEVIKPANGELSCE